MAITEKESKASKTEIPMIISVDDHLVEPPHLWQTWLPNKFKEKGPRVEPVSYTHLRAHETDS